MHYYNRTLPAILLGLFVAINQVRPSPLLRGRKEDQMARQSKQGADAIRGIMVDSNNTEVFLAQQSRIMKSKKKATQGSGDDVKKNTRNKARKKKKKNNRPQSNSGAGSNTSDNGDTSNHHAFTPFPTSKPTVSPTTKLTPSPTQAYHVTGWQDVHDSDGTSNSKQSKNDEDDGSRDYIGRDPNSVYEDEKVEQDEPEPIQGNKSGDNSSTNKKKNVNYYEYGWWWSISDSPTRSPKFSPTASPTPYATRAGRINAINSPEPIQGDGSEQKKNKNKKKNTDYYGWWWMSYSDSPTPSPTPHKGAPAQTRSDHVTGWEDYWKPQDRGDAEDGSEDYISKENGRSGNGAPQDPIQDEEPDKEVKTDLDYYGWWWFHD